MALPPYRVDYLPSIDRPRIEWPDKARVAFWVAPNVEHYEYLPPRDPQRNPWPRTPWPEVQGYGYRDYGNRVGFWRMLEAFDRFKVRATVSLNLAVYDHYPEIGAAMSEKHQSVPGAAPFSPAAICSLRVRKLTPVPSWSRGQAGSSRGTGRGGPFSR